MLSSRLNLKWGLSLLSADLWKGHRAITFAPEVFPLPPCVCSVNDLPCEWCVGHGDSELRGQCDPLMRHIKRGPIEICSGGKGPPSWALNQQEQYDRQPILKLPGSGRTLDDIKAENTHFTSHQAAHADSWLKSQNSTAPPNNPNTMLSLAGEKWLAEGLL